MNLTGKVLSVVGPTATGKTKRALELAEEALKSGQYEGVDLISADSRQVYQGLEVLTGADVPEGFEKKQSNVNFWSKYDSLVAVRTRSSATRSDKRSSLEKYFAQYCNYFSNENDLIRIFGVSMIRPSDEWSVAHFQQYARAIIIDSWLKNRLPILVGGTGLYHREVFRQDKKLHVPPNEEVRKKADGMSVEELREWLKKVDSQRLASMNESDRGNPRRLVRAIEIGLVENEMSRESNRTKNEQIADEISDESSWKMLKQVQHDELATQNGRKGRDREIADRVRNDDANAQDVDDSIIDWSRIKPETVFVSADLDLIKEKIEKRVKERFEHGAIDEVKWLLSLDLSPTLPVMSTLGVPEIFKFLQGETTADECQLLWSLHEYQYAKRQLTWWKK